MEALEEVRKMDGEEVPMEVLREEVLVQEKDCCFLMLNLMMKQEVPIVWGCYMLQHSRLVMLMFPLVSPCLSCVSFFCSGTNLSPKMNNIYILFILFHLFWWAPFNENAFYKCKYLSWRWLEHMTRKFGSDHPTVPYSNDLSTNIRLSF